MAQALSARHVATLVLASLTLALSGCPSAVRWDSAPSAKPSSGRSTSTSPSTSGPSTRQRPVVVPKTHKVRAGESLYAICLRYELSAADVAQWNRLGSGELIFPGQVLRLRPGPQAAATSSRPPKPAVPQSTKPAAGGGSGVPVRFIWPAQGAVVSTFADPAGVGKGIDIEGKVGDPVRASGAGRVVYSGDGLKGYGNLLIVKHSETYLSAYGYNQKLLVKEGDQVKSGQSIAQMGRGPDRRAVLHFEIRERGKPVDPQRHLPRR